MEQEARDALIREFGVTDADVLFERHAEMRYVGQRHNIKVLTTKTETPGDIRHDFDRDYQRRYGHADARAKVEVQALHLSAITRLRRPDLQRLPRGSTAGVAPVERQVYFGGHGWLEATIYDRASLAVGFAANGPAVIEEYGSTTLIWPDDSFEVGALHEIRIRCRDATGPS
jgi:N-methylhydantoinase A